MHGSLAAAVDVALPFEVWGGVAGDVRALSALCGEALADHATAEARQEIRRVHEVQAALARTVTERLRALASGLRQAA